MVSVIVDEYFGGIEPPQYILDQSDANNDGLVDIFDIVILIAQIICQNIDPAVLSQ